MQITPTLNQKAIATKVAQYGSDATELQVASYMTHSVEVARANYQHLVTIDQAVSVYSSLNRHTDQNEQSPAKRRKYSDEEFNTLKEYFQPTEVSKPPCANRAQAFLKYFQINGNFSRRHIQQVQDKAKTMIKQLKQ